MDAKKPQLRQYLAQVMRSRIEQRIDRITVLSLEAIT